MNKLIKTGLLILLASVVAMIFVYEYRSDEMIRFFESESPLIPMLIGGLLLAGVTTTLVGSILAIKAHIWGK